MRRKYVLGIACVVLACEATGFEPEYLVDTLRVLAVQADNPFTVPGQTVNLTTLWADPLGNGRTINWAWGTCLNPGGTQITDCSAALQTLTLGTDSLQVTVPANALDGVPPSAPIGEYGIIFAACAGTITLAFNPVNGAPVTCKDGTGAIVGRDGFIWGGTRLIVVQGFTNANPVIDKVFIDGAEWAPDFVWPIQPCTATDPTQCPTSAQHNLSYTATPDSAETYLSPTGSATEELVGWFYITQGTLTAGYALPDANDAGVPSSPPTFEMSFAPTQSDLTHPVHLWLVMRDNRGGITFTDRQFSWQ
jgi:hypothetical protein